MKEFKSIITHPEGQNLFPGQITTIEGYPHGTSVTMQNTKPQIALTPYGASYMMPNMDYKFAGNTVVELPMAQMGGQDQQQQLMEMIQVYAQMKGMKPEELIQKLQSLPKEQQQQAVQSIAQEVQQAMAQQQEAQMAEQQQEGMMGQQQEMGMAEMGGEPCIECFDKYNPSPQAQNLNWFYKAQGGEAFPQANTYPEDWASYHGNQYQKKGQTGNKSFIDRANSFIDKAEEESLKLVPSLLFDGNAPRKNIDLPYIANSIGRSINTFMKTSPLGMLFSTPVTVSNPSEEYGPQVEQSLKEGGKPLPKHQAKVSQTKGQQVQKLMSFPEIQKSLMEFGIDDTVAARIGRYIDNPNGLSTKYISNANDAAGFNVTNNPGKYPEDVSFWSLDDDLHHTRLSGSNSPTYGPTKYDPYLPEETSLKVNMADNVYRYYPIEQYIIKNNTDTIPFRKGGGEAFPQAQTYLPYDRAGETRPNFMFETGGQSNIEDVYRIMKKGGIDYNPSKKKGGKFNHLDEFQKYLEKGGGLKKYQYENSIVKPDPGKYGTRLYGPDNTFTNQAVDVNNGDVMFNPNEKDNWYGYGDYTSPDEFYNLHPNENRAVGLSGEGSTWNNWINSSNKQSTSGIGTNEDVQSWAKSQGIDDLGLNTTQLNTAYNNWKKQNEQTNDDDQTPFAKPSMLQETPKVEQPAPAVDPNSKTAQKEAAVNSYVNTGALPQGADPSKPYNPYTNPTDYKPTYNTEPKGGTDYSNYKITDSDKKEKKPANPYARTQRTGYLNAAAAMTGNKGLFGALAAVNNIGNAVGDAAAGWSHPGRAFKSQYAEGGELDKYQAWMSQKNDNWQHSDTPMSTFILPQAMRENAAYNTYLTSHPMASRDAFYSSNTTTNSQGQDYSFNPGSTADPNYAKFSTEGKFDEPEYTPTSPEKKEDKGWSFDFQRAEQDVAGLGQVASYIRNFKERNDPNKDKERRNMFTSEFMPVAQFGGGQYGDWSTNATQGTSFRPDEMVYAQKMGRPYKDVNIYDYSSDDFGDAFWGRTAKKGGTILDRYNEDDEYDLTEEEIRQIVAAGGTIEYL